MKISMILLFTLLLSGCAVNKQLTPTGGSRADGTVKLSYEYGMFEAPKIDEQQGKDAALAKCAAWGYSDATPFGGQVSTCVNRSNSGCNRWNVSVEYQCIGAPTTKIGE